MDLLRRLTIGACSCLLVAGCAGMAGSKERRVYPLPPSKKECASCHTEGGQRGPGALRQQPSELCLACHPDRLAPTEHKVDIVPSMQVRDLPLFEGNMTCVTCHDPHKNTYGALLRKPEADLCLSCRPY